MNRTIFALFILVGGLFLTACDSLSFAEPTPTLEPTVTPHMIMQVTCALAIRAMAWIDVNADGVQDTDEPPFPGVRFRRAGEDFWNEVSDESGYVTIEFMFGGEPVPFESLGSDLSCELASDRLLATGYFDVEPEIPSGYRLTTSSETYKYGFAPLSPSDFSLEKCAIQLVEEKYYLEQTEMKISSIKAGQVRIEGWAYECSSIEEMCSLGEESSTLSGKYVDVLIESRGNRCEVVENHSFEEFCVFWCPTPTPPT